MLANALRTRCPHFNCRYRHLQLRASSSEPTSWSSAQQTIGCQHSDNSFKSADSSVSDRKEAVLDPVAQAQLKRMLRVDHAGEFAAGTFLHIFLHERLFFVFCSIAASVSKMLSPPASQCAFIRGNAWF
jgi:hypothetical protein